MSCCCNDIFTCHAELIHAASDIQFVPYAQVTVPTNSNTQTLDFLGYYEIGDTVDFYNLGPGGEVISTLASGLTITDLDQGALQMVLSGPVDTVVPSGSVITFVRNISNDQTAIDRLYRRRLDKHRAEVTFLARHWGSGNIIKIIPTGTPVATNEVGPHNLAIGSYSVSIIKNEVSGLVRGVEAGILTDRTTGVISLIKASGAKAFSGRVEIIYAAS